MFFGGIMAKRRMRKAEIRQRRQRREKRQKKLKNELIMKAAEKKEKMS